MVEGKLLFSLHSLQMDCLYFFAEMVYTIL